MAAGNNPFGITWDDGNSGTVNATAWTTTASYPVALGYTLPAQPARCVHDGLRAAAGANKALATLEVSVSGDAHDCAVQESRGRVLLVDPLLRAAAHALDAGDVLGALKRVALRDDAPGLALRGVALARLGKRERARELLQSAAKAFGAAAPLGRARCLLADAEIALASRDLRGVDAALARVGRELVALGDPLNALHADCLAARGWLLRGRLSEAERALRALDTRHASAALRAEIALAWVELHVRTPNAQRRARRAERGRARGARGANPGHLAGSKDRPRVARRARGALDSSGSGAAARACASRERAASGARLADRCARLVGVCRQAFGSRSKGRAVLVRAAARARGSLAQRGDAA